MRFFVREILDANSRSRVRVKMEAEGRRGGTTLTRRPATHNRTSDSRALPHATAPWYERSIRQHPTKAHFSRSSRLHPQAKKRWHHPLRHSANEVSRIRSTFKKRQKEATDLPQFVAFW